VRPLATSTNVAAKKPTVLGSDRLVSRNEFPAMIAPASNPPNSGGPPPTGGDQRARDEQADEGADFGVERTKPEQSGPVGQGIDEQGAQRDLGEEGQGSPRP
jgi:hypothetical protein